MEWTDDAIARLKQFWAEGLSTAEIGRRMGVSKNAIVGKAHRLMLESRPSPIRRDLANRASKPPQPRRVVGPTLPSLAAPLAPAAEPSSRLTGLDESLTPRIGARPSPVFAAADPSPAKRRHHGCCWPIGEPCTRDFHFCDAEALAGKPYCQTHAALAYVKIRDRREDAA